MKKKYSPAQLKAIRYQYWLRSQQKKINEIPPKRTLNFKKVNKIKRKKELDEHEEYLLNNPLTKNNYDAFTKKLSQISYDNSYYYNYLDARIQPDLKAYAIEIGDPNMRGIHHIAKEAGYIPLKAQQLTYSSRNNYRIHEEDYGYEIYVKAKNEEEAIALFLEKHKPKYKKTIHQKEEFNYIKNSKPVIYHQFDGWVLQKAEHLAPKIPPIKEQKIEYETFGSIDD